MSEDAVQKLFDLFNEMRLEMSTGFTEIRTEMKRDKDENLSSRVRRLELLAVALVVIVGGKLLGIEIPLPG